MNGFQLLNICWLYVILEQYLSRVPWLMVNKMLSNTENNCILSCQNFSQTHMLNDLIQEVKEKGYKLRICPPVETNLVQFAKVYSLPLKAQSSLNQTSDRIDANYFAF